MKFVILLVKLIDKAKYNSFGFVLKLVCTGLSLYKSRFWLQSDYLVRLEFNMARILILIILIWLLYLIIKRIAASANARNNPEQKTEQKPEQQMVQCAQCGCHVPKSESQIKNDKITCSNPECQKIEGTKN
jgi:flagellar biosynthesis/type III secretory pathway M-ring protein FliF/YscJ